MLKPCVALPRCCSQPLIAAAQRTAERRPLFLRLKLQRACESEKRREGCKLLAVPHRGTSFSMLLGILTLLVGLVAMA